MSKALVIDAVKRSALTAQLGFNVGYRYLEFRYQDISLPYIAQNVLLLTLYHISKIAYDI